jgi:hypothetical protein
MSKVTRRGVVGGALALLLLLAFGGSRLAVHPVSAASPLAPELPLPGDQRDPAVATDGSGFLVVWDDQRSPDSSEHDIYAARVDADGNTLDPSGIAVSTRPGMEYEPDVSFDGTNYLVAWTDSTGFNRSEVRAARVSPDGKVLDPDGIVLTAQDQLGGYRPHIAFDGTNSLVVYENCYCMKGVRVSPEGTILDPGGFWISTTGFPLRSGVSYGAGEYFVTWNTIDGVRGSRVLPNASVLSTRAGSSSRRTPATPTLHRPSTARTSWSRGRISISTGRPSRSMPRGSRRMVRCSTSSESRSPRPRSRRRAILASLRAP